MCSVTKVAQAFVLVTDTYKQLCSKQTFPQNADIKKKWISEVNVRF